jgi:hypothetical protein
VPFEASDRRRSPCRPGRATTARFAAVPEFEGTLTLPGVISTDTTFPIAEFSVSNNSFGITKVEFAPDSSSIECSNSHLGSCDLLTTTNAIRTIPFGFPVGTFSKTGDNAANFFGEFGMDLTVSVVPETSTCAMMLLGFAGLGFAAFRCRSAWAVDQSIMIQVDV